MSASLIRQPVRLKILSLHLLPPLDFDAKVSFRSCAKDYRKRWTFSTGIEFE